MGGAIQGNPLTLANSVTTFAGTKGVAAKFSYSYGITTDKTNLYMADTYNHTIRKIVIATGEVTTLAGTAGQSGSTDGMGAAARFSYPEGIVTMAPTCMWLIATII